MDSICDIDSFYLLCWYILALPKGHKAANKIFMAYYGEASPSVVVTGGGSKASSAISTIADSASKIYQNTKEKAVGSKLGKKHKALKGAERASRIEMCQQRQIKKRKELEHGYSKTQYGIRRKHAHQGPEQNSGEPYR